MERNYSLIFRTDTGKLASMKVPFAKEAPSLAELRAAMERIINTGIVDVIEGEIVAPDRVSLVSYLTTEYEF